MLREKRRRRDGARPAEGHRAFLLLFFLSGALIARFAPGLTAALPEGRVVPSALVLLAAILGGGVCGVYGIPAEALLFGALLLRRLEALGLPRREALGAWGASLLPAAVLTAVFFAVACGGMRLSAECLAALAERGEREPQSVFLRELLLLALAGGAAALYMMI